MITIEVKHFGKGKDFIAKAFGDRNRGLLATATGLIIESAAAMCRANIKFPVPCTGEDIAVFGPDGKLVELHYSFGQGEE